MLFILLQFLTIVTIISSQRFIDEKEAKRKIHVLIKLKKIQDKLLEGMGLKNRPSLLTRGEKANRGVLKAIKHEQNQTATTVSPTGKYTFEIQEIISLSEPAGECVFTVKDIDQENNLLHIYPCFNHIVSRMSVMPRKIYF